MIIMLAASLVALAILNLFLLIRLKFKPLAVIILVPFLLFNIGFGWHTVNELWGSPRTSFPKNQEVQVLFAHVEKPSVFLLIRRPTDSVPLYVQIPYSKELEKQISKTQEDLKKGNRVLAARDHENIESIRMYKWSMATSGSKDAQ